MADYRRWFVPGGSYFFTLVTCGRATLFAGEAGRKLLGDKIRACQAKWPFEVNAIVLLPRHFDYIHYNAVKHGHVQSPMDWPYSSFHRWVDQGVYHRDWGSAAHGPLSFDDLDHTAMELL